MKLYYLSTSGWPAIVAIDGDRACWYNDGYDCENVIDPYTEAIVAYYPTKHPGHDEFTAAEDEAAAKAYLVALADVCIFDDFLPGNWAGTITELHETEWPEWKNDIVAEYDTEEAAE